MQIEKHSLIKNNYSCFNLKIILTFVIISIAVILPLVLRNVGLDDGQKVYEKLIGIPKLLLLIIILIGSVSEEIFFRAFLIEKTPFRFSSLFLEERLTWGGVGLVFNNRSVIRGSLR